MSRYQDANNDGAPDLAPEHTEVEVGTATDARNRALRTFIQGLGFDVLFAVLLFLLPIFGTTATDWSTLDLRLLLLSLAKTVVMTVLSFVARYFKVSLSTTTA